MNTNKGIIYSAIAHAILLILLVFKVVFYPEQAFDLSSAIRVDMVDLPEKMDMQALPEKMAPSEEKSEEKVAEKPPEPEKTPEPEKSKEVIKKPEAQAKKLPEKKEKTDEESVNIDKVKSKQQAALAKLKAAEALEKIKKEMASQKSNSPSQKEQVYKGRALSAGTALAGLDKLQSDSYLVQVDQKIKSYWTLPQWLIGKPLRARIQITINSDGSIATKKLIQSSGNPDYDDHCLQTIDKASPLPPVPEKFTNIYKINGVIIGFPD